MEMILNDSDMVVGAIFENGTIQDYVNKENTYGLIRYENTTANWFLYNDLDSPTDIRRLYEKVIEKEHFIKNDFGEEIVLFNKDGKISYEDLVKKIDEYLDDEIMSSSF
ncbi:hypothetical protein [Halarcobacter ebronensis]|uniref:Uncharacterized protein n=1 Tax=Halarcobacter ebronensis TaxID=1462615 RepID=A0A4Q1AK29_9BACT|nr:hypothetical protein [Halarcobacter ebronensis]QKF82207.1 hypothetical protein AEBR_1724 [Halarcobacter ebronensis]RXK03416.1 hypothetical protein CRV07_12100 [Halarcobacter ebronensis]